MREFVTRPSGGVDRFRNVRVLFRHQFHLLNPLIGYTLLNAKDAKENAKDAREISLPPLQAPLRPLRLSHSDETHEPPLQDRSRRNGRGLPRS